MLLSLLVLACALKGTLREEQCIVWVVKTRKMRDAQVAVLEKAWGGLSETPALCKAGTILICHHDLWHRALHCPDEYPGTKVMIKMVFARTCSPTAGATMAVPRPPLPEGCPVDGHLARK